MTNSDMAYILYKKNVANFATLYPSIWLENIKNLSFYAVWKINNKLYFDTKLSLAFKMSINIFNKGLK